MDTYNYEKPAVMIVFFVEINYTKCWLRGGKTNRFYQYQKKIVSTHFPDRDVGISTEVLGTSITAVEAKTVAS